VNTGAGAGWEGTTEKLIGPADALLLVRWLAGEVFVKLGWPGQAGAQAGTTPRGASGIDRSRTPHALKIAFAMAGATATIGVSPPPADG
jgi:hypothetical protein